MVAIASYFASLGFRVDRREIQKVDNHLKLIERKLQAFTKKLSKTGSLVFQINSFDVNQKKLNTTIGNALDRASLSVVFEISRFSVNQRNLQAAMHRATRATGVRSNNNLGNTYITQTRSLSPEEWNRRESDKNKEWNRRRAEIRADAQARIDARLARATGRAGYSSSLGGGVVGGVGGLAARAYMPAVGLALGGYGLGQLNRRNQEVVSAQLMTQAVVQQAGGTAEQGQQSFEWLRGEGDRVGFNYLEAAPDFNKLISGLTGAGMTVDDSQGVFQGFAELSRVNKLDKTSQNRLFRALSQVAGKNQLMSEELTGQIAEALPGGVALFAEAYQRQIGGNLTGTESIQALRAAMESRSVKGDILLSAGRVASEKARPGLSAASRASQAEQQRFQNQLNDQAINASNSGVESGFARLFKAMAVSLKESDGLVTSMARGFDNMTQKASAVLMTVQSMTRFFEGRDSYLGDKLFPDEESQQKAFLFMQNMKTLMTEIGTLTDNIYNGWSGILGMMETSSVLDKLNESIAMMANAANVFNSLANGNMTEAFSSAKSIGQNAANTISAPGRWGANKILAGAQYGLAGIDPRVTMDQITPYQIPAPFDKGQSELDWRTQYKAEQARMAADSKNKYSLPGVNTPLAAGQSSTNLEIKVDVSIQAANPEDFNQKFQDKFKAVLTEALLQSPQKE